MKWLKELSVARKFYLIVGLIILILVFGLVNFWFSMRIMSATRAYVNGEGLWSKAQKEAVISLIKYTTSSDESEYRNFLLYLQVPTGDMQARLELEKTNPNLALVRPGFIQGVNNPSDVNDLIFMYRQFRHVSYMDAVIQIWAQGDQKNEELMHVAEQIHTIVLSHSAKRALLLAPLVTSVYSLDNQLTVLENSFSATLGEGARRIRDILFLITIVLTLMLGIIAIVTAMSIGNIISQVDKAKSEFVSLASHQLRTPLATMNWYLEQMMNHKTRSGKQQEAYVEEVSRASKRMVTLINTLLNVSRLELGTLVAAPQKVVLPEVINQVLEDLHPQLLGMKMVVEREYQEHIPPLMADPKLLAIIMQNILSNAIKYNKKGGKIIVKTLFIKNKFIISITDDGIGIPKNQQKKIFTKLFRADNARRVDPEGNGLGLYIVKEILHVTGGTVWFTSKENIGTTFSISFPRGGMPKRMGKKG